MVLGQWHGCMVEKVAGAVRNQRANVERAGCYLSKKGSTFSLPSMTNVADTGEASQ